jgi:hypothetical protein
MRLGLFGPSRQEVDALAHDLIVRHGLEAYEEAIRLSEVVQLLPRAIRQRRLYELAAARIEQSFEIAREAARNPSEGHPAKAADMASNRSSRGLSRVKPAFPANS